MTQTHISPAHGSRIRGRWDCGCGRNGRRPRRNRTHSCGCLTRMRSSTRWSADACMYAGFIAGHELCSTPCMQVHGWALYLNSLSHMCLFFALLPADQRRPACGGRCSAAGRAPADHTHVQPVEEHPLAHRKLFRAVTGVGGMVVTSVGGKVGGGTEMVSR